MQAQDSLILFISYYLLFRQVKIFDSTLLSVILTVVMAHHIFVMRVPDRQKLLEQLHQQIIVDGPRPKHSQNSPIFDSYKMSEFFEKSPLSGAIKHRDFPVTLCLYFVTTDVDFAYIESE
jgi:hypothetical protein